MSDDDLKQFVVAALGYEPVSYGGEEIILSLVDIRKIIAADRAQREPVQQARVPDGWKLVPSDPDHNMVDAGRTRMHKHGRLRGNGQSIFDAYRAMLAAAPTPPQEGS